MDGKHVAPMWLEGRLDEIVAYNECDALTTYLLWLRMAHSIGYFNSGRYEFDSARYDHERKRLRDLIREESRREGRGHLSAYLSKWESLGGAPGDE